MLSASINFSNDNKYDIFEIIKKFIFVVFEKVYIKGIQSFLTDDMKSKDIKEEDINIYTLSDKLLNIINNINKNKIGEFAGNENFIKLKSIIEKYISDKNME